MRGGRQGEDDNVKSVDFISVFDIYYRYSRKEGMCLCCKQELSSVPGPWELLRYGPRFLPWSFLEQSVWQLQVPNFYSYPNPISHSDKQAICGKAKCIFHASPPEDTQ